MSIDVINTVAPTPFPGILHPVLSLTVVTEATTSDSIWLSWTLPEQGIATHLRIYTDTHQLLVELLWPTPEHQFLGLNPEQTYSYYIVTTDGLAESAPSPLATETTLPIPDTSLYPPTNFTMGAVTTSTIQVSWTPPLQGGATDYIIYWTDAGSTPSVTIPFGSSSYVISNLQAGTPYTAWIVTTDGVNESIIDGVDTKSTLTAQTGAFFSDDFESYTAGAALGTPYVDSFYTTVNGTGGVGGSQSAEIGFLSGIKDPPGFRKSIPTLSDNDEIWVRWRSKFQAGWLFNASTGFKFLRIREQRQDGSHVGYSDFYCAGSVYGDRAPYYYRNEGQGDTSKYSFGDKALHDIDPGTYHTFERYQKYSPIAGQGITRIWFDGELLYENTTEATLQASGNEMIQLLFTTHFNPQTGTAPYYSYNPVTGAIVENLPSGSGAPQNQTLNHDDVDIFTSLSGAPQNTDAAGNIYIGV